jgi:hypothetical protein
MTAAAVRRNGALVQGMGNPVEQGLTGGDSGSPVLPHECAAL